MKRKNDAAPDSPMRVYGLRDADGLPAACQARPILAKLKVYLPDRPGSLAALSAAIAECGGNIAFFHYDRAVHCNRVVLEVQYEDERGPERLVQFLRADGHDLAEPAGGEEELRVTALESVLEMKVRLENRPGTLAAFSALLKEHESNVTYMLYDEDIEPEAAHIALATASAAEVDRLLAAVNARGYYYKVVYRGSDQQGVDRVIGLNLLEKFFLNLRERLPREGLEELRELVGTSREFCDDLIGFYSEAGNNLDRAEVFSNILALASTSAARAKEGDAVTEAPPLEVDAQTRLLTFHLPTGANVFLFEHGDELTMFDSGYGVYYADLREHLRARGLDPARIGRIFVSHADADHVGGAGYFAEESGSEVFLHPDSSGVMQANDRARGTSSTVAELNRLFTRLVTAFTQCRYPARPRFFSDSARRALGGFNVIDSFTVGGLTFQVLHSHGGHIPGQVFFLEERRGLLFTSDYLLNVASLSAEDRDRMRVPRYLMTSTNTDSRVFRQESQALRRLALDLDARLRREGRRLLVLPGHGACYEAELLEDG